MAEFVVIVENVKTGAKREIRVAPNPALDPTYAAFVVGSGPDCDLVLADAKVAPRHAVIVRSGNHTMVTPERDAITVFMDAALPSGEASRVDYRPFTVGDHQLEVDYV